jgi:hypothetical protein
MEKPKDTKMITNEDFNTGGKTGRTEAKEDKKPKLRMKKFFFPQQGVSIEAENLAAATEKLNETYKPND